jgi:hypothetical protein
VVRTRTTIGVAAAIVVAAAAAASNASTATAPTVAECAQLQLKSPAFQKSRLAATVFCLRPTSIHSTASLTWTTCPSTPIAEPCAEGVVSVSFRSAAAPGEPDSLGGENFPGAGIFALRGTGTYRCKASDIDRQVGRTVLRSYTKTLPLRDQAVGFAAVGKKVKVTTSIHPGFRGPFGENASVRLGQPNTCQLAGLPVAVEAVRVAWPGTGFKTAALGSFSTRVTSSGTYPHSFPVSPSEGLSPGVKIEGQVKWSSTIVIVPALKRR